MPILVLFSKNQHMTTLNLSSYAFTTRKGVSGFRVDTIEPAKASNL